MTALKLHPPVHNMRIATAAFVMCVALLPVAGKAEVYGFGCITNNSATDCAIAEAQLSVEVTNAGTYANFVFRNTGPQASSITDLYFDDAPPGRDGSSPGVLGSMISITNGPGVSFTQYATPNNLPGGNTVTPSFVVSAGLSADSTAPVQPMGVNPGESVGISVAYAPGSNFDAVIAALGNAALRLGIHVQGFASGGSEALINTSVNASATPEPATFALVGGVLIGLSIFGRKRLRHQ